MKEITKVVRFHFPGNRWKWFEIAYESYRIESIASEWTPTAQRAMIDYWDERGDLQRLSIESTCIAEFDYTIMDNHYRGLSIEIPFLGKIENWEIPSA